MGRMIIVFRVFPITTAIKARVAVNHAAYSHDEVEDKTASAKVPSS